MWMRVIAILASIASKATVLKGAPSGVPRTQEEAIHVLDRVDFAAECSSSVFQASIRRITIHGAWIIGIIATDHAISTIFRGL